MQSKRASTLHLDQQVQPFLKWLQGHTKDPGNRINALTSNDLTDDPPPPLQAATPENNTNNLKVAHQGMLAGVAAAPTRETPLAAFLAIFTLL